MWAPYVTVRVSHYAHLEHAKTNFRTNYSNFPSSPVAIVHPAALRVTSTPPYELTSGEGRSASHNDAYHVDDLEWLDGIDEEELSSHESETVDSESYHVWVSLY